MLYAYLLGTSSHPALSDAQMYYRRDMHKLLNWFNSLLVEIWSQGIKDVQLN